MKQKKQQSMSLFETEQPVAVAAPPPPKIKDACPQCGSKSLKTVRPHEHGGSTHYCAGGCLSEDRTEAFYFMPRVETFVEQVEKLLSIDISKNEVVVEELTDLKPESVEEYFAPLLNETIQSAALVDLFGQPIEAKRAGALAERFIVPPFSVLDAKQGYWTKRKAEWMAMGITSESGRGMQAAISGSPMPLDRNKSSPGQNTGQDLMRGEGNNFVDRKAARIGGVCHEDKDGNHYESDVWDGVGTSIFDPVLCELAYEWFAPNGGKILDPFAGGSVRGIVAAKLGYDYTGIELRAEQIAANELQAAKIGVTPRWILGNSSKMDELIPMPPYKEMFDMVLACPPYYDLEQYSESNEDGSAKQTYVEFLSWYAGVFAKCVARLKWNRFLVIVVGEIRDENGFYRNFVGDTVETLRKLKVQYYNEAILLTSIGSLPLRVNKQFGGYRKLGKTHQNILVFYNGSNCDQIQEKFGELL